MTHEKQDVASDEEPSSAKEIAVCTTDHES
jgi:hypothetical protein